MKLTELIANVNTVKQKLADNIYMQNIISDIDAYVFIVDANAEEQLFKQGVNALGVKIASFAPYKLITIEHKKIKGQPYDRVTLRDTGDFERSFKVIIGKDSFRVDATDWKAEELKKKYGQIFGLTPQNKSKLAKTIVYPDLLLHLKTDLFRL